MTDVTTVNFGKNAKSRPACRVAYTLNNSQPVRSTIIDEQPLFYMDFTYEDEELEVHDDIEYGVLDDGLLNSGKRSKNFDTFSQNFWQPSDLKFELFQEDKKTVTNKIGGSDKNPDQRSLIEILSLSRLASAYLDLAYAQNISFHFDGSVGTSYYDRDTGTITINPNLSASDQILLTVSELRRHWQHRQGALIHPLTFQPDNAVLIHRLQQADLSVSMIRVAWELQLSGYKDVWERIESSPMADLGRAFAREAFLDFRTINNGLASTAVFESWFLSNRCQSFDRNLIKQMLADHQGYVFDLQNFENNLNVSLISALGEMPFGKNYLAPHANTILNDPIFTEVRDRSNANFLWFIKFEQSFREVEQELQNDADLSTGGIRISDIQEKGSHHANTQNPDIITLSGEEIWEDDPAQHSSKILRPKVKKQKGSADIIYLQRGYSDQ